MWATVKWGEMQGRVYIHVSKILLSEGGGYTCGPALRNGPPLILCEEIHHSPLEAGVTINTGTGRRSNVVCSQQPPTPGNGGCYIIIGMHIVMCITCWFLGHPAQISVSVPGWQHEYHKRINIANSQHLCATDCVSPRLIAVSLLPSNIPTAAICQTNI